MMFDEAWTIKSPLTSEQEYELLTMLDGKATSYTYNTDTNRLTAFTLPPFESFFLAVEQARAAREDY